VEVTGVNARRARLLLSPELFDLATPITVRVAGKTRKHTPVPSIRTLLTQFRRHRDAARLFPDVLELDW
jgi:hypothetical protein